MTHIAQDERAVGGNLGRPSGARYRVFTRLKHYADELNRTLFADPALNRALDEIYRHPLREATADTLNKRLREGIGDHELAELIIALRDEDRLCNTGGETETREPQIICSMGLFNANP